MKNYFKELLDLANKSYSPYSNFQVSAVVVTKDGREYKGINIENASFGATICAERSALSAAITEGHSGNDIIEVHLIGKPADCPVDKIPFTTPCGICRQVISELTNDNVKVVVYQSEEQFRVLSKNDLLPNAFTGEEMEND